MSGDQICVSQPEFFSLALCFDEGGKEVQIVYRLFLVNCYLLHVPRLPSQPASNVGGLVIHLTGLNWLDST